MVTRNDTWRDEASCATHPLRKVHAWDYDNLKHRKAAKAVCDDCPVRAACLDYAETNPGAEGMYGGQMFKVRSRRGLYESESDEVS